ncbi:L1 protein [Bos taurus papillomavirus 10]|uniref:Major capsid protein L1 n=2 Tax=Bos taurus papillomavirus 10 TaxID=453461 RepID=A9CR17_9PAPI|nr:L1 protein [Bos taurus papillomavirus 10]
MMQIVLLLLYHLMLMVMHLHPLHQDFHLLHFHLHIHPLSLLILRTAQPHFFCIQACFENTNINTGSFNFLQMSFWLPSAGRLYLPPPTPVTQYLDTDDFVTRTEIFYHTNTERLLTVGHPYFDIKDLEGKILVPKVSRSQFRVFRLKFPDPNKFSFPNANVYDPDKQRLVWAIRGVEICRGQPLGIGATGHPAFNRLADAENANKYPTQTTDDRMNMCVDPKQVQLFVVGCIPCDGEHWDVAQPCKKQNVGDCPPIELVNTLIEDGEMYDTGFGNMNFRALQATKSGAPLDIVNQTVEYPDFLKMGSDPYGNQMFFYAKREQMYLRHLWSRGGELGDTIPPNGGPVSPYYMSGTGNGRTTFVPSVYFGTPSGSLVSSDQQIYNRPFWIQRAQGANNGICWNNQCFITAVDTTRGTNFTISVHKSEEGPREQDTYTASDYKHYLRHVEEWEVSLIMQLCIVDLSPEAVAYLHGMNASILDNWNLGFIQPPNNLEDQYRYLSSVATRCAKPDDQPEKEDPYSKMHFWDVDLSERFSSNLEQHSLGRKFLFQIGKRATKRSAPKTVGFEKNTSKAAKRRRKNT